jgi:hypothetical protein
MVKEVSIVKKELEKEHWDILERGIKLFFKENPDAKPEDIQLLETGNLLNINVRAPMQMDEEPPQTKDELEFEDLKLENEQKKLYNEEYRIRNERNGQDLKTNNQEVIRRNIEVLLKVKFDSEPDEEIKKAVITKLKEHIKALEVPA